MPVVGELRPVSRLVCLCGCQAALAVNRVELGTAQVTPHLIGNRLLLGPHPEGIWSIKRLTYARASISFEPATEKERR